ncbi:MAG: penicillin-binding transpeptidase domain-containing protein, partial [Pyrinomonadaceae bacterium]
MTQTPRTPVAVRFALSSLLFIAIFSLNPAAWAKGKRPAPARKESARSDKKSRADKKSVASRRRDAREDKRRDSRADRRDKRNNQREARADKRRGKLSPREERAQRREEKGRPLSRRERLAESRRQAEIRRREIAEARRRAELARLAAIARQRAWEQGLRDEVSANISKDDATGEDMEVRRAAVSALGNHIGTVVVMNPKTGRVYSIVNQEWAVRRGFKPCSTIKLVTGLAGLSEKVIAPVESVEVSTASYHLDLTDALAYSNNGYFQNVGGRMGFDTMVKYARELGLGERTGINHANEYPGRIPVYKTGWSVNRMCSHGDDFEATPLQLATLTSAIANGGSLLTPHLPRTPQEDLNFKKEVRRQINVPPDALRRIVPGMIGSVSYGSGKKAYDPLQTIAGKTGTCIGQGGWVGLFTSYAPVADPQLAIVVITRGPDARAHVPAAIAGRIYRALDNRFGRLTPQQIANTPILLTPRPKINPKAAAAISDEDREDEAGEAAADAADAAAAQSGGSAPADTTTPNAPTYTQPRNTVKS